MTNSARTDLNSIAYHREQLLHRYGQKLMVTVLWWWRQRYDAWIFWRLKFLEKF